MKVNIITLGCSKNTVDSENIAGHLNHAGHRVFFDRQDNDCDIVMVNTCGFIGDAKEESVNELLVQINNKTNFNRRHSRDGRRRHLVVFGCLVERYREELCAEMPEIDAWYGAHEWEAIVADTLNYCDSPVQQPVRFTDQRAVSTPRHYAYLKISEGCNRSCSYCAIPHIRGGHVSRPIDDLVAEARKLVADGVREIILIAQDTTYYGVDLYGRRALGELLNRLALESNVEWIRLHYTYPTSFPIDAIEAIRRHPNICNYIDIPLQHINSRILSSMRRGIDKQGTLDLIAKFREQIPDVSIRTTLIVGYPEETEDDFQELLEFVREARFDRMGCFAYSPEEGTPAENLGDPIPEEVKQRRVSELMAVQERISLEKNEAKVGKTFKVLVDRQEGDYYIGRTEFDSPEVDDEVIINSSKPLCPGQFCQVRVTQALENDLYADCLID